MRKAQRLREEVAKGSEDRSHDRVWHSIVLDETKALAASTEDVLRKDVQTFDALLASFAEAEARAAAEEAAKAANAAAKLASSAPSTRNSLSAQKGGKSSDKSKAKGSMAEVPKEVTPAYTSSLVKVQLNREIALLPPAWVSEVQQVSAVRASVTTAHRTLLTERDEAVSRYMSELGVILEEIMDDYERLLTQEASWNERWNRQVKMLKKGNL
jgi:hypothetical protein